MQSKELKSLVIDVEKGIYEINGKDVKESGCAMTVNYENGKWSLMITEQTIYTVNDHSEINGDAEEKNELVHLRVVQEKVGFSMYLDDKYIHHIEKYDIEQSNFPGTAKLKIEMLVKYP